MKKAYILATLPLFLSFVLFSQELHFGVNAGMAPGLDPGTDHIFVNRASPRSEFTFNAVKVYEAPYIGGFVRMDLAEPFYLRAEAMYNQFNTDYELRFLGTEFPRSSKTSVFTETIRQIDLPVSMGVQLGTFDVTSGFTAHILLSQDTELDIFSNYRRTLDPVRFGFHTGFGAHFELLRIELRYVMDFFTYADHLNVGDQNLSLDNSPGRIMATMSYQF